MAGTIDSGVVAAGALATGGGVITVSGIVIFGAGCIGGTAITGSGRVVFGSGCTGGCGAIDSAGTESNIDGAFIGSGSGVGEGYSTAG